jgi:hypothetical protein
MAGNNYNLKGGYVQQGKIYTGQIKGDIAFVYSRLKTSDVIFGGTTGYTTENRSWRRVIVKKDYPQLFESGRDEGYCCIECPDNGGDYTSKQNCLDGVSDRINSPQIGNSSGYGGGTSVFLIYLLHKNPITPQWWGSYSESVLVPTSLTTGDMSSQWNYDDYPHLPWSYQARQPVANQAASTALIVPPSAGSAKGMIGWCGTLPSWKGEVWQRHQDSVLYFGYSKPLSYGNPSSPQSTALWHYGSQEGGWDAKFTPTPFDYKYDSPKSSGEDFFTAGNGLYATSGESNWCGTNNYRQAVTRANECVLEDPWCLEDPSRHYGGTKYYYPENNVPSGVLGSAPGPDGYETAVGSFVRRLTGDMMAVVWRGDSNEAASANALMNSIATYWEFEGFILCGGHTSLQGCFKGSDIGGNPNNLERPNPEKITWGEVKGRKSEVILNFQDLMGTVKELVLPVEFSSRPTHIRFEDPDFYSTGTSGWLPRDIWCGVEWFDSRISMTKDDIFVDILYELVQEWEPVGGAIKLLMSREQFSHQLDRPPVENPYYNVCGDYSSWQFLTGSTDLFHGYSRPKRTRFNKIKSFKINKKSFAITSTANYTYPTPPALSQETLHNNLIKHYSLVDHKTYDEYWDWYEVKFADGLSSETYEQYRSIKIPYLPNSSEYLGLPLVYPQLMIDPDQYSRANDFIKPQSSWTELDWIFWELLERPSKAIGGGSYVEFLKNGKFGFHGRTQKVTTSINSGGVVVKTDSPFAYYVRQPSGIGIGMSLNVPDYYLMVSESERLRGSAKIDDSGKIVKWWRISPISFPVIMTGGNKSNNSSVN